MLVLPSLNESAVCKQILVVNPMCMGVLHATTGCTTPVVYSDRHWLLCCMHLFISSVSVS